MIDQLAFEFEKTETEFRRYLAQNPAVYRMFCIFAHQALATGRKRIGAKMIAERMRWESAVTGNDGYKINNSYIAFFARKFAQDFPQHKDVFETRKARADVEKV